MILLIGKRRVDLRTAPWATLALLLTCALVTLGRTAPPVADADRLLADAAGYWSEHAYLVAEPEIVIEVGQGLDPIERLKQLEQLRHTSYARFPKEPGAKDAQQAELDDMTARAIATEASPPNGPGLIPAAPNRLETWLHPFGQPGTPALVANLLLIALIGGVLELSLGTLVFLPFMVGALVFPGVFYMAMVPTSTTPLLGAIGVSSTLLGVALLWFRETGIVVPGWSVRTPPPAWSLAVVWAAGAAAVAFTGPLAAFPYQAPLGGLLFGACAGAFWRARVSGLREPEVPVTNAALAVASTQAARPSAVELAREARERGDDEAAFSRLQKASREDPDRESVAAFWDLAVELDRAHAAAAAMLQLVKDCLAAGDPGPATHHWIKLTAYMPGVYLDGASQVELCAALVAQGEPGAARSALTTVLAADGEPLDASSLLRALALAEELEDSDLALAAARLGVQHPQLDADERARLQAALDEVADAAVAPVAVELPPVRELPPATSEAPPTAEVAEPTPAPEPQPDSEPAVLEPDILEPVLLDPEDVEIEVLPDEAESSGVVSRFSGLKVLEAVPEEIGARALRVRLSSEKTLEIEYAKMQALAAAGVMGLADDPVVLIDLLLNWNDDGDGEPLQVVRLRGDRFDPRTLVGDGVRRVEAYRALLGELHTLASPVPLPDAQAARGQPMRMFDSLAKYQREVLGVEGSDPER